MLVKLEKNKTEILPKEILLKARSNTKYIL